MKAEKDLTRNGINVFLTDAELSLFKSNVVGLLASSFANEIWKKVPKEQLIQHFVRTERMRSLIEKELSQKIVKTVSEKVMRAINGK